MLFIILLIIYDSMIDYDYHITDSFLLLTVKNPEPENIRFEKMTFKIVA